MRRKILTTFALLLAAAFASRAQSAFAVSTNLVDAVSSFTLDLNGQFTLSRNFTAEADFKKTIYGRKNNDYQVNDLWGAAAGFRWWPWYSLSGWFAGAGIQYQGSLASYSSWTHEKYHSVGPYIKGGHSFMLLEHLNVDLGLALWAGARYGAERMDYGTDFKDAATLKAFAGVADVVIAIVYVF